MKWKKMQKYFSQIIVVGYAFTFLTSCETKTDAINYGQDECAFCTMKINDDKYSAKILTAEGDNGKILTSGLNLILSNGLHFGTNSITMVLESLGIWSLVSPMNGKTIL